MGKFKHEILLGLTGVLLVGFMLAMPGCGGGETQAQAQGSEPETGRVELSEPIDTPAARFTKALETVESCPEFFINYAGGGTVHLAGDRLCADEDMIHGEFTVTVGERDPEPVGGSGCGTAGCSGDIKVMPLGLPSGVTVEPGDTVTVTSPCGRTAKVEAVEPGTCEPIGGVTPDTGLIEIRDHWEDAVGLTDDEADGLTVGHACRELARRGRVMRP